MKDVRNEEQAEYKSNFSRSQRLVENELIENAIEILENRMQYNNNIITSPDDTVNFLKLKMAELEHEVFAVIFLNNRHGVIKYKEMFRGTIDGASVYPREVMKEALHYNAAAVIFAHNHPSGNPEPSQADENITIRLKDALKLIDINVLDHIIIGNCDSVSLAERGVL